VVHDKLAALDDDVQAIQQRISERHEHDEDAQENIEEKDGSKRMPNESQRDFLIRTGKITPFASQGRSAPARASSNLEDAFLDREEGVAEENEEEVIEAAAQADEHLSHQNLRQPGFASTATADVKPVERPNKRQRVHENGVDDKNTLAEHRQGSALSPRSAQDDTSSVTNDLSDASYTGQETEAETSAATASDFGDLGDDQPTGVKSRKRMASGKRKAVKSADEAEQEDLSGIDDGHEALYQARLRTWVSRRSEARQAANEATSDTDANATARSGNADVEEWFMPHPTVPDTEIQDGIRLPGDIYPSLFSYQKTGVQWLCELRGQHAGGIIGDEMGLGKTIQAISFLAGLHYSRQLSKPVLVVAPATVLKQWVNEFHRWWPPLRVSILHTSGSGMLNVGRESRMEDGIERGVEGKSGKPTKAQAAAAKIVKTVVDKGHVLVTTYAGMQTYARHLLPIAWEYALLDEGHKIRNPNAAITIFCKQLRTVNRLILSGTPMQNNLTELWSLFDFVFPMRLGTLLDFKNQFEAPIRIGGFANATNLELQTAQECAARLKEAISPFLLQRLKADVAADLPKKTELVLTCNLTPAQTEDYKRYLDSDDVRKIHNGLLRIFSGIETLRKICNHPDLIDRAVLKKKTNYNYGDPSRSGKMLVVKNLLEKWKQDGHKTLLFAQQKIMLDILEKYIGTFDGVTFRRMDGDTPIEHRQGLVDEFNNTPDLHVFLLTTKVGGLGINLTGADRVIIFDPDWNPATDTQARERAWRLGQKREVLIYRLITAGTIEEKIYHRQLFKQFLANKVMKDPSQRRTMPMTDLHDFFSYGSGDGRQTETGRLFQGTETMLEEGSNGARGEAADGPHWGGASPEASGSQDPDAVRDVEGITDVHTYRSGEADSAGENQRLMDRMLARSGVQSSVEHDEIINGRPKLKADPEVTRRQAKRFADNSARQLAKAAEVARTVPIGTVTWTGQQGETGRPRAHHPEAHRSRPDGNQRPGPDFAKLIRRFFAVHRDKVVSKMLLDHFNPMCRDEIQQKRFLEVLDKVAVLDPAAPLRGKWTLRDEHK
jgi:DNA excision repair protein ERCC-6